MATHDTPDVFPVRTSGGAGLTRRQTQARGFITPTTGVRRRVDAPTSHSTDIAVALAARPEGTAITDLSAAWWWELPLPPWLRDGPPTVSMSVLPDRSHARRPGIRGRRLDLPSDHLTLLRSVPLTTPARTWLDCAALIPPGHVVAMGDAVLHRTLATEEELRAMCHWAFRRRGVAVARRALPLLNRGAESPGESLTRFALLMGRLPPPQCNADVVVDGEWLARVDMLWPAERVIVEYDGAVHLSEPQRQNDAARRNLLQAAGYYVIVVTARDLRHTHQLVLTVRSALLARHPR